MMWIINRILTVVFDVLYVPLGILPRWASLTLLSCAVGFLALLVVKYCSNQRAIGKVKDDIKANMLAIKLFKDDVGVMFGAQGRLIWAALRMQFHMLPPLLVMMVPFLFMAAQMGLRYQWAPLEVGKPALLTAVVADPSDWSNLDLEVRKDPAFEVRKRLRSASDGTVTWELEAKQDGVHVVELRKGAAAFTKEVSVGAAAARVCPMRPGRSLFDNMLYPVEAPFAADSPVRSVTLAYPPRDSWYAGADWWVLWFLVVSMAFALAIKPILKVKL